MASSLEVLMRGGWLDLLGLHGLSIEAHNVYHKVSGLKVSSSISSTLESYILRTDGRVVVDFNSVDPCFLRGLVA
jgi:hypothetical protein